MENIDKEQKIKIVLIFALVVLIFSMAFGILKVLKIKNEVSKYKQEYTERVDEVQVISMPEINEKDENYSNYRILIDARVILTKSKEELLQIDKEIEKLKSYSFLFYNLDAKKDLLIYSKQKMNYINEQLEKIQKEISKDPILILKQDKDLIMRINKYFKNGIKNSEDFNNVSNLVEILKTKNLSNQ